MTTFEEHVFTELNYLAATRSYTYTFFQIFPVGEDGRLIIDISEIEMPDEMVSIKFIFTDPATDDLIEVPVVIETLELVACNEPGMLCKYLFNCISSYAVMWSRLTFLSSCFNVCIFLYSIRVSTT